MKPFHVAIAAEAFAAAMFAQAGCDVSVQYGANQPEYDLIVTRRGIIKKVSVKGSKDGGWVLTASYLDNGDYHGAISRWASEHDAAVIYCLVQFKNVSFGSLPRIYLARVDEVAKYLRESRDGHGYTSLREHHSWTSGIAQNTVDVIPENWKISEARIDEMIAA